MSSTPQQISRAEIIRLGQSGKPWAFLPIGLAAVKSVPGDMGVRFLVAAGFAQLGLRTPATEQLDAIVQAQSQAADNPDLIALRRALAGLPDDRITTPHAHQTAMRNLRALRASRPQVAEVIARALDAWTSRTCERFRTSDGQVVQRLGHEWMAIADHRSLASEFAARHLAQGSSRLHKPVVIEGIRPPWLLLATLRATPSTLIGYQPRVILVQRDPIELLDGLAMTDLSDVLTDPRLVCFIGNDAGRELHTWLDEHRRAQIAGVVVTTPGTTPARTPAVSEAIQSVVRTQENEHRAMKARVEAQYAQRDRAWWADRYRQARSGQGEPLRVLIPTSVYTTFVQHASEDLANAMRSKGMQVEVLKEQDRFEMLATTATLDAIDRIKPDLVVMINHTRRVPLGDLLPENLPLVTWMQDSMPGIFQREHARADGPMDFVVGHLLHNAMLSLGAAQHRTLAFPVVADAAKFHDGPIDAALLREHACEVSIATHQSEPVHALVARWMDEQTDARLRAAGQLVVCEVQALIETGEPRLLHRLKWTVINAVEAQFGGRDQHAINTIRYGLALPLADRMLRHRVIGWAAQVCATRGWRLGLYGKGWDRHPTLSRWARGEAEHGEELRAIYQTSRAHLHVSVHTLMHQRVLECALSGGLPLCLLGEAAVGCLRSRMFEELIGSTTPLHTDARGTMHFPPDATPLACRFHAVSRCCGWPSEQTIALDAELGARYRQGTVPVPPEHHDPTWLLGDLSELGFLNRDHLAERLEQAIMDDPWRAGQSRAVRTRVLQHLTHACMVDPVLDLIEQNLANDAQETLVARGAA